MARRPRPNPAAERLREYHRKRDLRASGEPDAASPPTAPEHRERPPRFVIQKHDATRLHFDLRLEMSGTLKSWAVPKGLPSEPGGKALAVAVEDHPMEYGEFEGVIPAGNYGAGTVMLWDRGVYSVGGGDPDRALREGKIHCALIGEKLRGEWTLVRLRPRSGDSKENWLVLRNRNSGPGVRPGVDLDRSVLTHRTLAEIAAGRAARKPNARRPPDRTAPQPTRRSSRARYPVGLENSLAELRTPATSPQASSPGVDFVEPMKALGTEKVPPGDWKLEIKFDGYRALAAVHPRAVTLWSRNHRDLTGDYPEVVAALRRLRCGRALLDGEIVAVDATGRASFQLLQQRSKRGARPPLHYYVFDLLELDGRSLLGEPLETRQAELARLIGPGTDTVRASPVFAVAPDQLLAAARERGLEGIVAKRAGSHYEPGRRSGAWLKCRLAHEQEFVIGGLTAPQGARTRFGALVVGYYHGKQLHCAGKVGTGFSDAALRDLDAQLRPLAVAHCPFENLPLSSRGRFGAGLNAAAMRRITWVRPQFVCQVRFTEWTEDGLLRHPVYLGLRHDKRARDVRREKLARPPPD